MNPIRDFDLIFPREYLRAALIVSLLSVWVLVGLFYYLNRYTKRHYFTIWTAAWLFYALWLTLGITFPNPSPTSFMFVLRHWCVSISAVFLLWGSLVFLEQRAPQRYFGLLIAFLLTWTYVGRQVVHNPMYIQVPVFVLIGLGSMFSGLSFYRLKLDRQFVAAGMLLLGFFLWGIYLMTYPFTLNYTALFNAGFLCSAVLQLFIAVSMIVLVLEEARHINEQVLEQIRCADEEKRDLQIKIVSAEAKCRSLFEVARSREDLQNAYDELRQTQQSVVQQERLRALGQMASGVAHDINNALSPIMAFSEMLLKKEANLSEHSRKNLNHIQTAAEDIAQIVTRMSEFYRRREQDDQLSSISIASLVGQVIDLTSPCWRDIPQGHGTLIQIEQRLDDPLPEFYGNGSDLREALTNIVLNAVDALPKGGVITISGRTICTEGAASSNSGPTHLVLEVADNGIGMDEKTRQRCLEPFFSTKRERGGTGLGLAMVYGMIERHEGHIEISSQPNKGTTVRLVLPLRRRPDSKPPAVASVDAQASEHLRVLCIDDEPLLRELLKEVLEFHHHEVKTAGGGQEGLDEFMNARGDGRSFDAVITDLGMPGVNGRQVAEKIKAESPGTPVIMLTGWANMLEDQRENVDRADAILSKPPRASELVETLTRLTGCQTRTQNIGAQTKGSPGTSNLKN